MGHNTPETSGGTVSSSQSEVTKSEVSDLNHDATEEARVETHEEVNPDTIDDIEKARVMAEAGDEYRTAAAKKREEARIEEEKAARFAKIRDSRLEAARALVKEARYNAIRDDTHRQWAQEDLQSTHKSEEIGEIYDRKAIESMRKARAYAQEAKNLDHMADMAESDAEANYDFRKSKHAEKLDDTEKITEPNTAVDYDSGKSMPEYMLPENKERYDQALAELDPGVTEEISGALYTLLQLVGPSSPEYKAIVDMVNEKIFEGQYKKAHLIQGIGHLKIIVGVGE